MNARTLFKTIIITLAVVFFTIPAQAADTIKIAFLDPLTGPFANVGDLEYKHYAYAADAINAKGGVLGGKKLEIIPFDSKLSPKESLIQLQRAIDQGIQYVVQGNASSVSGALIQAINKHNKRNPDQQVLYFNYSAITPSFTNEKCNFWHFRFDAHVDMKVAVIAEYLADRKDIKKVYLINQDYVFGHSVSQAAKDMLKEKRPDIEIVGDSFHPVGKVKDFSPYIAKIQASGAQAIITGNWGNDMTLLIKSGAAAGLDVEYFTFYAGGLGGPTAIGHDGIEKVYMVSEWNNALCMEMDQPKDEAYMLEFSKKYDIDFFFGRIRTLMEMFAEGLEKAGSADPKKVAYALEGMDLDTPFGAAVMRADDHQLLQPLFIAKLVKQGDYKAKYDVEGTGMGWANVKKVDAAGTALPTTCKMKRP